MHLYLSSLVLWRGFLIQCTVLVLCIWYIYIYKLIYVRKKKHCNVYIIYITLYGLIEKSIKSEIIILHTSNANNFHFLAPHTHDWNFCHQLRFKLHARLRAPLKSLGTIVQRMVSLGTIIKRQADLVLTGAQFRVPSNPSNISAIIFRGFQEGTTTGEQIIMHDNGIDSNWFVTK